MSDRLDDVLREVATVREELGYPGMATPFSQLVGIQSVLNLVTGDRYSTVPDEIVQYALGYYGPPAAPIAPNVLDRIMTSARAKVIKAQPPEQPTIEELRRGHGTQDDDELLLRVIIPETALERMRAAGPLQRDYPLLSTPELDQARRLMQIANLPSVELRSGELSLQLRR
jgi:oxaloacetate decarboxylase alpha subunit